MIAAPNVDMYRLSPEPGPNNIVLSADHLRRLVRDPPSLNGSGARP